MKPLLNDVLTRALRYLDERDERPVGVSEENAEASLQLGGSLPDEGLDAAQIIAKLDELGSPATTCIAGPRYFGFVNGGTLPAALAANWLATVWDQNAAMHVMSPVASTLEQVALDWVVSLLGLPAGTNGTLTTGATVANFTCLAAARHAVLEKAGWDVESQGLYGAPPITVIVGEEAHVTLFKALGLLGMGRERVVKVPADGQGRMRADLVPKVYGPAIVCLQADNVNSGAFDPAEEIIAKLKGRAWVHVDGAFGLWALAGHRRDVAGGCQYADSWATDGHKYLNVSYDCGIALVRDTAALRAAMSITAAYLPAGAHRNGMEWGPESSRRARGIEVWAALLSLGRIGLAEMVERCTRHARQFAFQLEAAGFQILNEVVLNQVLVSFGSDNTTRAVIERVQKDGTCWCGGTVWHGRAAMRISVSSWLTTEADVERSVAAMVRCAAGAL